MRTSACMPCCCARTQLTKPSPPCPLRPGSNNLLYPEVDRSNHVLMYSCRNCNFTEEAKHNLVFRNDLKSVTKEQPGVIDSIRTDPTLPRRNDHICPECGHSE